MGKRRSGEGEQGGNQYEWRQIRGAPELLSLILNQRGEGLHDSVDRENGWSKARWRGMQHLGCLWFSFKFLLKFQEETIAGFPSASQPLYSYPPTRVLILKLLKSFPFILIHKIFTRLPITSLRIDWTVITGSVHEDFLGALLFLLSSCFLFVFL